MVICRDSNKSLEPRKINGLTVKQEWGPWVRERTWVLTDRDGRGVTSGIRALSYVKPVLTREVVLRAVGSQRGRCDLLLGVNCNILGSGIYSGA